ncbi:carbohydrate binding domain-containing protein [Streptomyces actuosus]|uniref:Carbohydrate binding domain-containing protein n=1 Tax=Streptomyces actuosus TaxID=1885 RepID=A0ABS2VZT9_STRAS|nr:carbohydrate binding domain-containing protein [Streptomyces actuosus]MBN0048673.1 carbohydrate binding domain-containing protein [Streptomyces actuosus]
MRTSLPRRPRRRLLALLGTAALAFTGAVALPGTAEAADILTNPGFEAGLSPWTCTGNLGSVVSSPVHGGSKALQGAASSSDTAQCSQTVAVQPNTTYSLSGWVRGSYVYLGVNGGPSTWTTSPSSYSKLSVSFTTGASQTSATVYLHGWYAQGSYYADDVSLDGPGGGGGSDTQAPTAPTGLTSTGKTSSSVSLAWHAATDNVGVTGYDVYRGSSKVLSVSGTAGTVGGLASSTSYTFTVRARDAAGNTSAASNAVTVTTDAGGGGGGSGFKQAAPYLYEGWGDPPNPQTVMNATGVKAFTMAFVLDSGGCTPAWDGQRSLTGGVDQTAINQIRAAGGDVVPSFGGWQGSKLGANCSSASALAAATQKVIDAFGLKAVDFDIENSDEFENEAVQAKILTALKTLKANNPGLRTIVTFGTSTTGPTYYGNRLIEQAKSIGAGIDVFTIMPFDFGGGSDMYGNTVNAAEGLKSKLKSTFGWDDATAYAHIGISGMNGLSDQRENTTPTIWTQIRDWANGHHIARLAFWSVNRDRPCPGGGVTSNCSGISQSNWQFTSITAGFTG